MRVLVTGAAGFVGRAVARHLAEAGHETTAMVRRPVPALELGGAAIAVADLRDRQALAEVVVRGGFDAVCHLGGLTRVRDSIAEPLSYFDVNVAGTINLLQALAGRPGWACVAFASTMAVYGPIEARRPIDETFETRPGNPYAASKLAAEGIMAAQAATGAIGVVCLRCFNVAGAVDPPGDPDRTRVIPRALAVAAGEEPVFPLNGDGSAVREFVHVADAAEAFRLAIESAEQGRHEVVNIGSGVGISMREVLSLVEELTGRQVPIQALPPKPEAQYVVARIDRARERLGWTPSARSDIRTVIADAWAAWRR